MFDTLGALKDLGFALLSIFIGLFIVSLLMSCSQYKYESRSNEITPEIEFSKTDEIILEYKLGPLLIIDEVELESTKLNRLLKQKGVILELDIIYDDATESNYNGFIYYLKGNRLNKKPTHPVDMKSLMRYEDKIPGFKWLIKDYDEVEEEVQSEDFIKKDDEVKKSKPKSKKSISSGFKKL